MAGFGSPCGACKFLRRKCVKGCVFAPYFCYDQGATHFAAIHKVFGASNVSKLLLHLPSPIVSMPLLPSLMKLKQGFKIPSMVVSLISLHSTTSCGFGSTISFSQSTSITKLC
ncbi:putative transcription factor AS2-LOB family [Dioscorea sansibarensis]